MAFPVLDFVCLQCDDAEDAADLISINPLRSDNTRKEKRRTFLNKYFYRPSITGSNVVTGTFLNISAAVME